MHRIRGYLVFLSLLIMFAFSTWGGQPGLTYRVYERDGYREIEVNTALASYVFSEDGGALKSVFLNFATYGTNEIELVPGTETDASNLVRKYVKGAQFPFSLRQDGQEGKYILSSHRQLDPDELLVEFTGTIGELSVIKRFTIKNDPYYTIWADLKIDNSTQEAVKLHMSVGDYTPKEKGPELVYRFDEATVSALLAKGSYQTFDGVGLMDKNTVFFLKPTGGEEASPFAERLPSGNRHFGLLLSAQPGTSSYSWLLYGGRRRFLLMEEVGVGGLDDPGTMARMMIPVIQFLGWLYRVTGNYGWAIILFTILTRVVLFPIMRKQYHSMAKMQKIQPKLKKLQERFKDDRQLMQKKLMELYKKEGVNPMGGCLPMFVQLPILILLWKAVIYSAEQIHLSPGFLWLSDLSLRDPYFILVILTTAVMILQQRLMTPMTAGETSGSQKYMGYIFPLFMAFFLYNFPAGLWLYYLLTTLFQVGQQYFINWEMAVAEEGGEVAAKPALDGEQDDDREGKTGD
ncbi:MAG: membrane protein insertase YidC [Candidatus Bipolaricaulota bacterium]|nr:membrane protein insertase YidC [Candidatus Bipolaricaulota bacterium]